MRDFWRGNHHMLREFACRLSGSPDLYGSNGRNPAASINFITCHDGFTLSDLVSYDRKHNHTNCEWNGDGEDNNRAWNCGMEGPTSDAATNELRARQRRNFVATLLLSRGVPMLLSGDELGRTQLGNNNAYCQDNEVSWIDWENADGDFVRFVAAMLRLRREHRTLHHLHFLNGAGTWFRNDGQPMSQSDWDTGYAKALGVLITTDEGHFYAAFNAHFGTILFRIPDQPQPRHWTMIVNTVHPTVLTAHHPMIDSTFSVAPHSMMLLRASALRPPISGILPPDLRNSTD
jgi:glycogen operon protein